jgi:GGDEF domain-containing protein
MRYRKTTLEGARAMTPIDNLIGNESTDFEDSTKRILEVISTALDFGDDVTPALRQELNDLTIILNNFLQGTGDDLPNMDTLSDAIEVYQAALYHAARTEIKELETCYLHLASLLTRHLGAMGKMARFYREVAMTDGLTGLLNLHGIKLEWPKQLEHALRTNRHILIFFSDTNHFGVNNKLFDHRVGNDILVLITQIFKQSFSRQGDQAFFARTLLEEEEYVNYVRDMGDELFAVITVPDEDIHMRNLDKEEYRLYPGKWGHRTLLYITRRINHVLYSYQKGMNPDDYEKFCKEVGYPFPMEIAASAVWVKPNEPGFDVLYAHDVNVEEYHIDCPPIDMLTPEEALSTFLRQASKAMSKAKVLLKEDRREGKALTLR